MKITELIIDSKKTVGTHLLLTDASPYYEYVNGTRSDKVKGTKFEVVMQERGFEKIAVKVEGKHQNDILLNGEYIEVEFDNLELFVYWLNGSYQVGARATGLHPLKRQN